MFASKQPLRSVVYRSDAVPGFSAVDLQQLLTASRTRNRAASITGMLLVEHGRFLQALEGPEDAVHGLLERIAADPRHVHVAVLADEPIDARRFPDWAMANGRMGDADAKPLERYFEELLAARQTLPGAAPRPGRRTP